MTTAGPLGRQRSTGISILLAVVTLGIYTYVWVYSTAKEMKQHTGTGLGGGIALLIYVLLSPVTFFLHASEVGDLYTRAGHPAPVSGITGLWVLLPIAGPIVWFVKVNGALNTYWSGFTTPRV
jgi:hypothetical protein